VLLKIRLHCDGCADRIRRRIYKIKGVCASSFSDVHLSDSAAFHPGFAVNFFLSGSSKINAFDFVVFLSQG
jgi:copper chaperone CopZ